MKTTCIPLFGALTVCAFLCKASAGSVDATIETQAPAERDHDWQFRIEPYGWLTGLKGDTGVGPLVAGLDQSFSDIFDNINMAAALQFEARKGRWGMIADGFYADLGADASTPGPLYDSASVDVSQFIGELSVAYRIHETQNAYVDVYGGIRYNNMSMDFEATLDSAGIETLSEQASGRIVTGIGEKAGNLAAQKADDFRSATAAERTGIESRLTTAIVAEADGRVKRDLEKQLLRIRRQGGLDARDLVSKRITVAVKKERIALAEATAKLEVARLRAEVDASKKGLVTKAQSRVARAEENLAGAIEKQLTNSLPTVAAADKNWLDPIIGIRAQWDLNERWFLAGKCDIGGFGVGSDFTWTAQGTVGYQFTEAVSAELGYRYMDTDYSDGAFVYDVAEHGLYTGLNIRF
jgi:hypothetical protein